MAEAAEKAEPALRVAAISGSLRRASANTGLIRAGKLALLSASLLAFVRARFQAEQRGVPVKLRRCARTPSRGCRSSTSTSRTCRCSTPTSRPTPGSRRPSRRSATRSAGRTASSSPLQSTTTPFQVLKSLNNYVKKKNLSTSQLFCNYMTYLQSDRLSGCVRTYR